MVTLEAGSVAYAFLQLLLGQEDTHTIRLEERRNGVAIKRNEGVWSPTLATVPNPAQPPRQPSSIIVTE